MPGSIATRIVVARSEALIPVVTPKRGAASTLTVKAVACDSVLCSTICGRSSARQRSGVSVRQMSPRPCLVMKLMRAGVTLSAAEDEVALVLPVLVIGDDDDLPGANVLNCLFDLAERHLWLPRRLAR